MIPSCLKLDDRQLEVLEKFFKSCQIEIDLMTEETCTMDGPMFTCYSTGLGAVIYVRIGQRRCHLGYDDDGHIIGEVDHHAT